MGNKKLKALFWLDFFIWLAFCVFTVVYYPITAFGTTNGVGKLFINDWTVLISYLMLYLTFAPLIYSCILYCCEEEAKGSTVMHSIYSMSVFVFAVIEALVIFLQLENVYVRETDRWDSSWVDEDMDLTINKIETELECCGLYQQSKHELKRCFLYNQTYGFDYEKNIQKTCGEDVKRITKKYLYILAISFLVFGCLHLISFIIAVKYIKEVFPSSSSVAADENDGFGTEFRRNENNNDDGVYDIPYGNE